MKGLEIMYNMYNMSGLQYNTPSPEHTPNIQFICSTYFGELEKPSNKIAVFIQSLVLEPKQPNQ